MKKEVPIRTTHVKSQKINKLPKELVVSVSVGDIEAVKAAVNENNINAVDKSGRTLLHTAVISHAKPIVEFLILKGALLDIHDSLGWVALHYAAQQYDIEMASILIKAGAHIDAIDNYGNSVLWRAVFESKGRGEIIKLLLADGATPTLENNKGNSPLNLADTIANYDVKQFFN
jgi:ankyrin repeat protein